VSDYASPAYLTDTFLRDLSEAEHGRALDPRNEPDEVRRCDVDPVWKEEGEEGDVP